MNPQTAPNDRASAPDYTVHVGDWAELGPAAQAVRSAVFVQEQGIPAELEWDAADAWALHALAVGPQGEPLATGRALAHAPGVARIGRMAVQRAQRGTGIGRAVLDALLAACRARGDTQALLHAQASAVDFYLRAGFKAQGDAFMEAGIVHQEMVRAL
jgi:predicted GNAT family N-acyltransferase